MLGMEKDVLFRSKHAPTQPFFESDSGGSVVTQGCPMSRKPLLSQISETAFTS